MEYKYISKLDNIVDRIESLLSDICYKTENVVEGVNDLIFEIDVLEDVDIFTTDLDYENLELDENVTELYSLIETFKDEINFIKDRLSKKETVIW